MMNNIQDKINIWNEVKSIISSKLSTVTFDVWIEPLNPITISDNKFVLIAPYESVRDVINKTFKKDIEDALIQVAPYLEGITIVTPSDAGVFSAPSYETYSNPELEEKQEEPTNNYYTKFDEKFTFDNFVVGGSNKAAFTAAQVVAENPGVQHNPLFIYGGVGLGKTHIMHAIGNYIVAKSPNKKIIYLTSENFTNDYIDSIRNNNANDMNKQFRNKYRNLDVLMIDDIQFISGKPSTQEALFHLFNELYQAKKQIVFTSDCHPREIDNIDERLKSRFQSGLTVDISNPDIEERIAILRKKAFNKKFNVSNEVINYIAECINTNVRELEGALSKVIFYCQIEGIIKADSIDIVDKALKDEIDTKTGPITMNSILKTVADYFNIEQTDILGKTKTKKIAEARQICYYLIYDMISTPVMEIGKFFDRDHTTVSYGNSKISSLIRKDPRYANYVRDLTDLIKKKN